MTPDTPAPATEASVLPWHRDAANRWLSHDRFSGGSAGVLANTIAKFDPARHHASRPVATETRGLLEVIKDVIYFRSKRIAGEPQSDRAMHQFEIEEADEIFEAIRAHLATFGAAGVLSPDRVTPDGSSKGNPEVAAAPIPIAEREPVFPCWLWCQPEKVWVRTNSEWATIGKKFMVGWWPFTHWLPDQPVAPTARPSQPAGPETSRSIFAANVDS